MANKSDNYKPDYQVYEPKYLKIKKSSNMLRDLEQHLGKPSAPMKEPNVASSARPTSRKTSGPPGCKVGNKKKTNTDVYKRGLYPRHAIDSGVVYGSGRNKKDGIPSMPSPPKEAQRPSSWHSNDSSRAIQADELVTALLASGLIADGKGRSSPKSMKDSMVNPTPA